MSQSKEIGLLLKVPFKSEIDWTTWNPEILDNKDLMQEYAVIERRGKEDDTWMKVPRDYRIYSKIDEINLDDMKEKMQNSMLSTRNRELVERLVQGLEIAKEESTNYQGTPEQFVQEHSENFRRAFPNPSITYRGHWGNSTYKGSLAQSEDQNIGSIYTADKKAAVHYGKDRIIEGAFDKDVGLLELVYNESDNSFRFSSNGAGWSCLYKEDIPQPHRGKINALFGDSDHTTTEVLAKYIELCNIDYVKIRNVFDGTEIKEETIFNHRLGNYMKSRWHNNGMFDMNDPNIYK